MSRLPLQTVTPPLRATRPQPETPGRPASGQSAVMRIWAGLRWPLPALLAWGAAWGLFAVLMGQGAGSGTAVLAALLLGAGAGLLAAASGQSRWRAGIVAAGFPVSWGLQALVHGVGWRGSATAAPSAGATAWLDGTLGQGLLGHLPAWAWLIPLALLLLAYPLRAWRDAPFFPTPADALDGLNEIVPLPPGAQILDAGCGLGHGLRALRRHYPHAQLHGVEWSWPLRWLAALRCPWARIRRGDLWARSWRDQDLVYLFQRPESMARAAAKARQDMRPGTWLVSLEFKVPGLRLHAVLQREDARPVWVYAIGPSTRRR